MDENFWFTIIGIAVAVLALRAIAVRKVDGWRHRLPVQEKKTLIDSSEPGMEDIQKLAESGKMIEAIKLVRQKTGCGLKEAKDYVDGLKG